MFTFPTNGVAGPLRRVRRRRQQAGPGLRRRPSPARQYLQAVVLDEIQIPLVPVLPDTGRHMFDHAKTGKFELEHTRAVASPGGTHLRCRDVKTVGGDTGA